MKSPKTVTYCHASFSNPFCSRLAHFLFSLAENSKKANFMLIESANVDIIFFIFFNIMVKKISSCLPVQSERRFEQRFKTKSSWKLLLIRLFGCTNLS